MQLCANQVKVVTYVRDHAHHVARGRKTLQMGSAITFLVSTHSTCTCKNYVPMCSQTPMNYIICNFVGHVCLLLSVYIHTLKFDRSEIDEK